MNVSICKKVIFWNPHTLSDASGGKEMKASQFDFFLPLHVWRRSVPFHNWNFTKYVILEECTLVKGALTIFFICSMYTRYIVAKKYQIKCFLTLKHCCDVSPS